MKVIVILTKYYIHLNHSAGAEVRGRAILWFRTLYELIILLLKLKNYKRRLFSWFAELPSSFFILNVTEP